jgi:hypothetical protein
MLVVNRLGYIALYNIVFSTSIGSSSTRAQFVDYIRPSHHTQSLHCDAPVMQVIASITATSYCILLNVHFIVSVYITVTLYVRAG